MVHVAIPHIQGKGLGKENLDRVMNNARWLINEISGRI